MRKAFMNDGVATLSLTELDDDMICIELEGAHISYNLDTLENTIAKYRTLDYKLIGFEEV